MSIESYNRLFSLQLLKSIIFVKYQVQRLHTVMNSKRTSCWDAGHVVVELIGIGVGGVDGVDDISGGGGNGRDPSRGCNIQVSVYSLQ